MTEDDAATHDDQDTVDPQEEQQEAWAAAEGYTPLADMSLILNNPYNNGSVMVSMGPTLSASEEEDDDDDNIRGGGGAFFVNPAAFQNIGLEEDDETGESAVGNENPPTFSRLPREEGGAIGVVVDDFQSLADKALMALDEEYQSTLRQEHGNLDSSSSAAIENEDNRAEDDDDDELKRIIAAGFDKKKKDGASSSFTVDWGKIPSASASAPAKRVTGDIPKVDTDAVRKAVQALSKKKDAPFQTKFAHWQEKQKSLPPHHELIPETPYKAFCRSTQKAKKATKTLSRSAIIAEVLVQLFTKDKEELVGNDKDKLVIDIVGVDHVECESTELIQTTFRPIVRWIGAWKKNAYSEVLLRLVGRDLRVATAEPVNLMTPNTPTSLKRAIATCHSGVYHDWLEVNKDISPDLIVLYNAGIWGYEEWKPTINYLASHLGAATPTVITAYTLEECQEDFEVIQETVTGDRSTAVAKILWKPEMNPFASKVIRETRSRSNEYRENASWQAWSLGGGSTGNSSA